MNSDSKMTHNTSQTNTIITKPKLLDRVRSITPEGVWEFVLYCIFFVGASMAAEMVINAISPATKHATILETVAGAAITAIVWRFIERTLTKKSEET